MKPLIKRKLLIKSTVPLLSSLPCLPRSSRWIGAFVTVTLLSGCGALWDSIHPPVEERDKLAFHLGRTEPHVGWQIRTGPLGDPRVYIQPAALFTGSAIELAAPMVDARKQYFVGVKLNPQASARLARATENSVGESVVLLWESRLVNVMPIDAPIMLGTFAIPVKDLSAAYDLSRLLSPAP